MNDMVPVNAFAPPPVIASGGAIRSAATPLSRKAKAAVIVRLLLNEGADLPLEILPDELQIGLTRQMSEMRTVDRSTLDSIIEEFTGEVGQVGLHPGCLLHVEQRFGRCQYCQT